MKNNKVTLALIITIIAVFTYLGFIVSELTQFNDITTDDVTISNAIQQAVIFHTIKILLCLLLIGYICIEIKGYYDRRKELKDIKDKVKDFADFLAISRSKFEESNNMFSIRRTREGIKYPDTFNDKPKDVSNIFSEMMKQDIIFDKKVQAKPERTDYPIGAMGTTLYNEALEKYNNEKS